jgi:hypothetical protein
MPCGEMAPTLQDVSYLLGLPLDGGAVGPQEVPPNWREDLEARFAEVVRRQDAPPLEGHSEATTGPSKKWLLQFQVLQGSLRRMWTILRDVPHYVFFPFNL